MRGGAAPPHPGIYRVPPPGMKPNEDQPSAIAISAKTLLSGGVLGATGKKGFYVTHCSKTTTRGWAKG